MHKCTQVHIYISQSLSVSHTPTHIYMYVTEKKSNISVYYFTFFCLDSNSKLKRKILPRPFYRQVLKKNPNQLLHVIKEVDPQNYVVCSEHKFT